MRRWAGVGSVAALVMILVLATAGDALAHCDGLDGPVVNLARQACLRQCLCSLPPFRGAVV